MPSTTLLIRILIPLMYCWFAPLAAAAPPGLLRDFSGVWQGVDPEDGSLQTLAITRTGRRDAQVLVHDSWFALCNGERGIGKGQGVLSVSKTLEVADYALICADGVARGGPTRFTLGPHGALTRVLAPPSPPITYYRISR